MCFVFAMDASTCKKKFIALFDKLLHNKFELSAYHAERLLECLDDNRDKCLAKVIETPFFAELLLTAIKNDAIASTSVKIFIHKLVTLVLRNEVHFNRFVSLQGFGLMVRSRGDIAGMPMGLRLAAVHQMNALATHYTGVKYAMENKVYAKVLTPNTCAKPPEIYTMTYDFIKKLAWKLNEYEEEAALLELLKFLVDPIVAPASLTSSGAENRAAGRQPALSYLYALKHILSDVECLIAPNSVVLLLSDVISIESKLMSSLETAQEPALARLLAEVWLRCRYAASRRALRLDPACESRLNQDLYAAFYKMTCTLVQKGSYATAIEFLHDCHVFWYKVDQIVPPVAFERFGKMYLLQNQFLLLLLMPICMIHKAKRLVDDPSMEKAKDVFHDRLSDKVPYDVIKIAYEMKKVIMEAADDVYMVRAACRAVRQLLLLRRQLSRRQAGVVFQTLYYALSTYLLSDGSGALVLAHNPLEAPDDQRLLALVLDAIAMLLDEHQINWCESLEIVELQAALMNLIKQRIMPVNLLVRAVELMSMTVRKLLSPELALLMESRRGGSVREVAAAARALVLCAEPEVRLVGMKLLLSFINVAYVKFIPLRAVISEHGLVVHAARSALADALPSAQAAALRCLAAAAPCEDLWKELLAHHHGLYEQLVCIIRNHPEGEVRQEAVSVLTHVYINHKVTAAFTGRVSRVMARAAAEDPHPPVQVAALNYWKQFIKTQFTDRGMIDGKFPSVTFCKEKRKIIVLNDKEIHKQLETIMRHLSNSGCLAVLLKCMSPYNNREVIEIAYQLTSSIVNVLDNYKYNIPSTKSSQPSIKHTDIEMEHEPEFMKHETDLITEIFECLGQSSGEDGSHVEIVPPNTFVESYREMAKTWTTEKVDLGTLIDELVSLH